MAIQSANEFAWLIDIQPFAERVALIRTRDNAIRVEAIVLETQRADYWRKEWVKSERARASSSATQPEPAKECLHAGYGATYRDGGPHAYCNNCGVRVT